MAPTGAPSCQGLLQNVDKTLYGNVFAFGLAELASFDKLKGDDVASRIYGAGLGIGVIDPVRVEAGFEGSAGGLFAPGGQKRVVNAILADLEKVDANLRARNLPAEFEASSEELRVAEAEREALVAGVASLEAAVARAGRHAACWPAWQDLLDAEARRLAMGEVALLPVGLAEELANATRGRDDAARHEAGQRTTRAEAAEALEAIVVDDTVLAQRAALESLAGEAIKDAARADQLAETQRRVAGATATLGRALERLGPGWDAPRVERFDDSLPVESELNGRWREVLTRAREGLASATTAHAGAGRSRAAVESDLAKLREQAAALADPEGSPGVEELERRLRDVDAAAAARSTAAGAVERARQTVEQARSAFEAAPGGRRWSEVGADAAELAQAIRDEASGRAMLAALAPALAAGVPTAPRRVSLPAWAIILAGIVVAAILAVAGQLLAAAVALAAGVSLGAMVWWTARLGVAGASGPVPGGGAAAAYANAERAVRDAAARRASLAARTGLAADAVPADVDALAARAARGMRGETDLAFLGAAAERAAVDARAAAEGLAGVAVAAGLSRDPSAAERVEFAHRVAEARSRGVRRDLLQGRVDEMTATLSARCGDEARAAEGLEQAEAASVDVAGQWAAWLERHDLAGMPDRETAQRQVAAVTGAKAEQAGLASLRAQIGTLVTSHAAFAQTATTLGVALGRWTEGSGTADGDALVRLVGSLASAHAAAAAADARRMAAAEALAAADRAHGQAARELADAAASLEALLAAHEVPNADALRGALARSAEARGFDDRIEAAGGVLAAQSGTGEALEGLRAELAAVGGLADIDAACATAVAERDEAKAQLAELSERIGGLKRSVEGMLRDASVSVERQRREDLLGSLDEKARDWAVYTVARHLLHTSRQAYESAHRPAVIGIAERHFAAWTEGRFTRILAPMGSVIEAVQRSDGERVALDALSMGTAQQLYLAIRFGLLEHFAQNAEPLPVVMDDILVNFDPVRAEHAAASIRELARTHQVIYFTCHQEVLLTPDVELTLERL